MNYSYLTPDEELGISKHQIALEIFQKKLRQIINSNISTADLLQLTLERTHDSYYYGFNFDHQLWLIAQCTEMSGMQTNNTPFTGQYCAQLFIEYSRYIPQLDPINELMHVLPILFRAITSLYQFNQTAINVCTREYPKLRLYAAPFRRQEIQRLKDELLTFLTNGITPNDNLAKTLDQKIIWYADFLQIIDIEPLKGK